MSDAGFAISVYDQSLIEENARDRFSDVEFRETVQQNGWMDRSGAITLSGWSLLNEDVYKIEKNSMAWMGRKFSRVRDDGHDQYGDLVGAFEFDPRDASQAQLVDLAADTGRQERVDMVDASYGDLANTALDGVSDFGAAVLGGAITFHDVKPEDMEVIEDTLWRARHGGRPLQRSKRPTRARSSRPTHRRGARESRRDDRPISLTFGVLPPFERFLRDVRRPDPDHPGQAYWPAGTLFPMELVDGAEIDLVERFGGLTPFTGRYAHKAGFRGDERAVYDLIGFLVEQWNEGDEAAGELASSIMTVLGYEWI